MTGFERVIPPATHDLGPLPDSRCPLTGGEGFEDEGVTAHARRHRAGTEARGLGSAGRGCGKEHATCAGPRPPRPDPAASTPLPLSPASPMCHQEVRAKLSAQQSEGLREPGGTSHCSKPVTHQALLFDCQPPTLPTRLPRWLSGKESACQAGDVSLIPRSGRSLQKDMATHCSIPAWEIPRTEAPGGLQSLGSQRVGRDLVP